VYLRSIPDELTRVGRVKPGEDCYVWACRPTRYVIVATGDVADGAILYGVDVLRDTSGKPTRICEGCRSLVRSAQRDLCVHDQSEPPAGHHAQYARYRTEPPPGERLREVGADA
jgi:hypothetical protein